MKRDKLISKFAIIASIATGLLNFGLFPHASASGPDLTGNYNCRDGSLYDPLIDDVIQTYYVYSLSPDPGYEVGSGNYCTGHVEIVEGVTSIGNTAFDGATGITSLSIPNSVTSIGNQAFRYVSLISKTFSSPVKYVVAINCSGNSSRKLPKCNCRPA